MRLCRMSKAHYAGVRSVLRPQHISDSHCDRERAVCVGRLDERPVFGIIHLSQERRWRLAETPREDKTMALRRHHALNPRPQAVSDSAFTSGNAFFDARDLVQVKYEMLRRVSEAGQPVTQAAADFGFSRPSLYQAQAV